MALTPIDIAFLEIAENFNKAEVFPLLPVLCSQCEWKITAKNREQIINFLNDVADKKKYEILEQNRDVLNGDSNPDFWTLVNIRFPK
jgi:hypothetical protein